MQLIVLLHFGALNFIYSARRKGRRQGSIGAIDATKFDILWRKCAFL